MVATGPTVARADRRQDNLGCSDEKLPAGTGQTRGLL